ncbi:MAG: hypothetical protein ACLFR7_04675 [Opitutales bacterium]
MANRPFVALLGSLLCASGVSALTFEFLAGFPSVYADVHIVPADVSGDGSVVTGSFQTPGEGTPLWRGFVWRSNGDSASGEVTEVPLPDGYRAVQTVSDDGSLYRAGATFVEGDTTVFDLEAVGAPVQTRWWAEVGVSADGSVLFGRGLELGDPGWIWREEADPLALPDGITPLLMTDGGTLFGRDHGSRSPTADGSFELVRSSDGTEWSHHTVFTPSADESAFRLVAMTDDERLFLGMVDDVYGETAAPFLWSALTGRRPLALESEDGRLNFIDELYRFSGDGRLGSGIGQDYPDDDYDCIRFRIPFVFVRRADGTQVWTIEELVDLAAPTIPVGWRFVEGPVLVTDDGDTVIGTAVRYTDELGNCLRKPFRLTGLREALDAEGPVEWLWLENLGWAFDRHYPWIWSERLEAWLYLADGSRRESAILYHQPSKQWWWTSLAAGDWYWNYARREWGTLTPADQQS